MTKGQRFYHYRWLDPIRMPERHAALFEVTKVTKSAIYYRPVYDAGNSGERLGGVEWCPPRDFAKISSGVAS